MLTTEGQSVLPEVPEYTSVARFARPHTLPGCWLFEIDSDNSSHELVISDQLQLLNSKNPRPKRYSNSFWTFTTKFRIYGRRFSRSFSWLMTRFFAPSSALASSV